MKNSQELLQFSRKERIGIVTTIVIILSILCLPKFLLFSKPPIQASDFKDFKTFQLKDTGQNEVAFIPKTKSTSVPQTQNSKPLRPKPFDPNTIQKSELIEMGVNEKAAKSWINYLNKGGYFKNEKDISKVFNLTEDEKKALLPFVKINHQEKQKNQWTSYKKTKTGEKSNYSKTYDYQKPSTLTIEINEASVEEWQKLYGIGKVFSKRIVKYRKALGGFHSVQQLQSVYGLEDSTYQKILPFLINTHKTLDKLAINKAELKTLYKHPYISKRLAYQIINHRNNHGEFLDFNAFMEAIEIDGDKAALLKPYIEY